MPRPSKGPRLYLEERPGREAYWIIRDGSKRIRTGCPHGDRAEAEKALGRYLAEKHEPVVAGRETSVADILLIYAEHNSADPVPWHMRALAPFWVGKTLADVTAKSCRAYVASRKVKPATARRELETLNAAIRYCAKEKGTPIVLVDYPDKAEPRDRWLTRQEVARLLRAARAQGNRHLCWFILVCLYTGTRSGAVLKMQWEPSVTGGYVDLDRGIMYRRGTAQKETRKRQPPLRIPAKLLAHLKRWRQAQDRQWARRVEKANGRPLPARCLHIIQYGNKPLLKERRAWARARIAAGLGAEVTPHVLRHTCATWIMASGKVPTWEAAGFLGMSEKMLEQVYGKHSPEFQRNAANAF
jgi:integrase